MKLTKKHVGMMCGANVDNSYVTGVIRFIIRSGKSRAVSVDTDFTEDFCVFFHEVVCVWHAPVAPAPPGDV